MFEPEYRIGFRVLRKQLGLRSTLKAVIPAALKSMTINYETGKNLDETELKKERIKNHFRLMAVMYNELLKRFGSQTTNEIMREVLMEGGQAFFRGFAPLGAEDDLIDFIDTYKAFESHNIVFDVIEESKQRFEIVIRRCLIYEAFRELGLGDLTQWMCDIAFAYFKSYHPKMEYTKDRMIARGDDSCHEVFVWQG